MDEYYRRLQNIRDDGDWEGWLVFFLDGVTETATEAATTVRAILDVRERDRQRIAGPRNQRWLYTDYLALFRPSDR